jgi:thioredoxin 1
MKNTIIFVLLGVLALGAIGYKTFNKNIIPSDKMQVIVEDTMQKDQVMEQKEMMAKAGSYTTYAPEKIGQNEKTVLFFNASWCPTCRSADADIKAKVGTIPAGVSILSVDYDTYKDLKQKYGVTTQHTFVQVDKNGTKISSWKGGALSTIITNIQ